MTAPSIATASLSRQELVEKLMETSEELDQLQHDADKIKQQIIDIDSKGGSCDFQTMGRHVLSAKFSDLTSLNTWKVLPATHGTFVARRYHNGLKIESKVNASLGSAQTKLSYLDTPVFEFDSKLTPAQWRKRTSKVTAEETVEGILWAVLADLVKQSIYIGAPIDQVFLVDDSKLAQVIKKETDPGQLFILNTQRAQGRKAKKLIDEYSRLTSNRDALKRVAQDVQTQETGDANGKMDASLLPRTYTAGDTGELKVHVENRNSYYCKITVENQFTGEKIMTISNAYFYFGSYSYRQGLTIKEYADSIQNAISREYRFKVGQNL